MIRTLTQTIVIGAALVIAWLALPATIAFADCSPDPGTGGNDNIICDSNPANDTNGIDTGIGSDTVTITTGAIVTNVSGGFNAIRSTGTDVTVNNEGNLNGDNAGIFADGNVTHSGSGDSSGTTAGILAGGTVANSSAGDVTGHTGAIADGINAGGNVTNSGSGNVTGVRNGINSGGNVTNSGTGIVSGTVGIIGNNANQNIDIQNGMITGTGGTAIDASGGDDTVTINTQATITGTIDGGNHTTGDTLIFTGNASQAEIDAINAAFGGCAPCTGTVTAAGKSYTFLNFEALQNLLTVLAAQGVDVAISFDDADPGSASVANEICTGPVKVFRLPNGDLQVYSGFDVLPPNGFLVAQIPQDLQQVGGIFNNASAPPGGQGWTATLEVIDGQQRIVVRDAVGNIINNGCQW